MAAYQQAREKGIPLLRPASLLTLGLLIILTGSALILASLHSRDTELVDAGPTSVTQVHGRRMGPDATAYKPPSQNNGDNCSQQLDIPKVPAWRTHATRSRINYSLTDYSLSCLAQDHKDFASSTLSLLSCSLSFAANPSAYGYCDACTASGGSDVFDAWRHAP
jgi:hypothetical protein